MNADDKEWCYEALRKALIARRNSVICMIGAGLALACSLASLVLRITQ